MGLFRHPHLVRGVVHTPHGAFRIDRGVVNLPDEMGESLGWVRIDDDSPKTTPRAAPAPAAQPQESVRVAPVTSDAAPAAAQRTRNVRTTATPEATGPDAALDVVLNAVKAVVRSHHRIAVPDHGIDVAFDAGVVAICRSCEISWEVNRRQFTNLAWWSCPRGCRSAALHSATN